MKGCTRVDDDENYTHFERTPTGEVHVRPYNGIPITGPKLLTIGPGSDPELLKNILSSDFNFSPLCGPIFALTKVETLPFISLSLKPPEIER